MSLNFKHCVTVAIILLLLWSVVVTNAKTIDVCKLCDHTTIRSGVEFASSGDTITIHQGIYKENELIIDKPLTLIGKKESIIDGEKKGNILLIDANYVNIMGLTFINVGSSYTEDFAAIKLRKTKYCRIENNFLDNVFFGIVLEKSRQALIKGNQIKSNAKDEFNSGNGIHLWYCQNITIDSNALYNLRDGIYLEFVDSSTITRNISKNNLRYGLHFMFSNYDVYSNNLFQNNGAGVAVMFSKHIKMFQNTFTKNWGVASYGLLLKEINDAEISHNVFEENTIGINVEGTNRINYFANDFKSNGWAVKIHGGCYLNNFKQNNFLHNTFDISYNGKMNDNTFDNNYWSNYTGYDLNKDQIGDVPFRPVKLFSYVVNKTPETIILLRSLFIDLINVSEKVSPIFTPDNLIDNQPLMNIYRDKN